MFHFIILVVVFFGGAVFMAALYKREVEIANRLKTAWLHGDAEFKKEIAKLSAEFKKVFHVG